MEFDAKYHSASYEKILLPAVTLTGVNSMGKMLNTTLSSTEASFVNGVFADATTTTTKAFAASPPLQTLVVASNQPFVVPGLHILIFPIGGIVTGVWAVLFIATLVYGTFGRIQFREQFRRRARGSKGDVARI